MRTFADIMRGHEFRRVKDPDGTERIEDHCTLDEIYAANTMTRSEFELLQKEQQLNEMERRRESRRRYAAERERERHDRMAEEWEASHG